MSEEIKKSIKNGTEHNWRLRAFTRSKTPPPPPFHSVLPITFPLLIIPAERDGAHQTVLVNPGPGTGSELLLCLAIPIEPERWQWQETQNAWRFTDRMDGEDDLSAKHCSSFRCRHGRLFLASTFRTHRIFRASTQEHTSNTPSISPFLYFSTSVFIMTVPLSLPTTFSGCCKLLDLDRSGGKNSTKND